MSALGKLIAKRRKELKVSQSQLAEALGYSTPQFVSNWERGISKVPVDKFRRISKKLKIQLNQMVEMRSAELSAELTEYLAPSVDLDTDN